MPIIKMPDGKKVRFPDDMPKEEIRAKILSKFPELAQQGNTVEIGPTKAPAEEPAPEAPVEEPNGLVSAIGNTAAFLNNAADVASFGIAPAIQRTVMNAFNPGSGDALQRDIDYTNQQNPMGSAAGFVAGIPLGAVATGPVAATIGNAGRIGNAFIQGGGRAGNAARMAGFGAASGATEAATHGEDPFLGATVGAVAGPIAGVIAKPVIETVKKIAPGLTAQSAKAWRYLAGKLGEDPATLERHVANYRARTGRDPSVAQIVSDHDAGVIAEMGTLLPHAGQELRAGARGAATGARTGGAATLPNAPVLLRAVPAGDVSVTALLDARDAAMDTAMTPLRQTVVQLDPDLIDDINRSGVVGSRTLRELRDRISTGTATLDDVDKLRRRLDKAANGAIPNPDIADLADAVEQAARNQVAEYGTLMNDYAAASRYIDSFKLGRSGTARGSITDPGDRAALRSAEGQQGFTLGEELRTSADRANAAAPGSLRPSDDAGGGSRFATGAVDVGIGAPISGVRQVMQGMERTFKNLNMSPEAQREVGRLLASTSPADVRRALARLRAAGADNAAIQRAQSIASAAMAEQSTATMLQTEGAY